MTKLRVAVSDDGAAWRPVDGGRTFATGVQPTEEGAVWIIEFDNAVSARYVKVGNVFFFLFSRFPSPILLAP